jgi:hypothetical protein
VSKPSVNPPLTGARRLWIVDGTTLRGPSRRTSDLAQVSAALAATFVRAALCLTADNASHQAIGGMASRGDDLHRDTSRNARIIWRSLAISPPTRRLRAPVAPWTEFAQYGEEANETIQSFRRSVPSSHRGSREHLRSSIGGLGPVTLLSASFCIQPEFLQAWGPGRRLSAESAADARLIDTDMACQGFVCKAKPLLQGADRVNGGPCPFGRGRRASGLSSQWSHFRLDFGYALNTL